MRIEHHPQRVGGRGCTHRIGFLRNPIDEIAEDAVHGDHGFDEQLRLAATGCRRVERVLLCCGVRQEGAGEVVDQRTTGCVDLLSGGGSVEQCLAEDRDVSRELAVMALDGVDSTRILCGGGNDNLVDTHGRFLSVARRWWRGGMAFRRPIYYSYFRGK